MTVCADFLFVSFEEYKGQIPELCHTMQQYYVTYYVTSFYMSLSAVIYRYRARHIKRLLTASPIVHSHREFFANLVVLVHHFYITVGLSS